MPSVGGVTWERLEKIRRDDPGQQELCNIIGFDQWKRHYHYRKGVMPLPDAIKREIERIEASIEARREELRRLNDLLRRSTTR